MAKDKFNRFKPINWNSNWKQTGSFRTGYVKPLPKSRSHEQSLFINDLLSNYSDQMNPYELDFIRSISSHSYELTQKQKKVLRIIWEKCCLLVP